MNAGELCHLVTIQTPGALVPDGDGQSTQAWTSLTPEEWAAISPATARDLERKMAGSVNAVATHLVQLHYRDDVTTRCRMLFSKTGSVAVDANGDPTSSAARIFSIVGVQNPEEADVELLLACVEDLSE